MFKRALTLMMIVAAVGAAGLLSPGPVDATGHSATRSFSAASAVMGGTVEVTIEVADLGGFGGVTETLPDGFSYVSTTLADEPVIDGQDVTFALLDEDSFSYTVRAPDTLGTHTFHGVVKDNELDSNEVGGDSDVMVRPSAVDASRSFSSSAVDAGGELTVTITAAEYGQFGQVVETLPAGFGYVSTSLDDPPWVSGQMLGFSLFGENSFTYTVTVSRVLGTHNFSGVVKDETRMEAAVGGDSTVTVQAAAASHSATRSVDTRVEAGAEVVVTIELEGLGGFGQVKETLPEGFAYVASSLPDDQVGSADGTLTFTILRDDSFTYTVTASDVEGDHALSGEALNDVRMQAETGGAASIAVGSTVVASDGGNVMLTITPDAQSVYFKGRIVEGCEAGPADAGDVALCATIDAWDAAGAEIVDFSLDAPSMLTLTLTAEQVTELGGTEMFAALHEAGGVMVHAKAGSADEWTALEAEGAFGEDGSVTLTTSITAFGQFAVEVPTLVPGATVVVPNAAAIVSSAGGNAMLAIPAGSSGEIYQVRIVEGCGDDGGPADAGDVALCATVDAWDAQGGEIVGFSLDAPSTLTLTLTAEQVTELGGTETLTALHEAGGVMVHASSADGWTALEAEAAFGEDGSVTLTTSITAFGDVAVTLDRALLPSTGGVTPPSWLMLFLALAGAAMIPTGVLVLRRIRA